MTRRKSQVRSSHGAGVVLGGERLSRARWLRTDDAGVLVVHNDGRGHILRILVQAEEARCRLWRGGGGGSLLETRSMNVPSLLVESLSGGSTFVGDPGVPHRAFHVIVSVLQLSQIQVDPLRSTALSVASLQPVWGDGDVPRLPAPITFGSDGAERAGKLAGDSPRPGVGDHQLPICRKPRGEQPYLFSRLYGILLVAVSPAGVLDSPGELDLYCAMGTELMVFEPVYIHMGG